MCILLFSEVTLFKYNVSTVLSPIVGAHWCRKLQVGADRCKFVQSDEVGCNLVYIAADRCKLVKSGVVGCRLVQFGTTC